MHNENEYEKKNNRSMKNIVTIGFLLVSVVVFGQNTISLNECYDLVNANYPLAKQSAVQKEKNDLDVEVIRKMKMPTLELDAQSTYQSDVISLPIELPNMNIESPNQFQYKAAVTGNVLLYDGGLINERMKVKEFELKTQEKQTEVSLYQLKQKVNQLYFSILLLQEKQQLLEANKDKVKAKIDDVQAGIDSGVVLPTTSDALRVELLKIDQREIELEQSKNGLLKTLSLLLGTTIPAGTVLEFSEVELMPNENAQRPELALFQLKKQQLDLTSHLVSKENRPKLIGFGNYGLGNPGLNMLDPTLQPYYIVGLKLKWNFYDWGINKKKQEAIAVNKKLIDNQEEIFRLQNAMESEQQESAIQKAEALMEMDDSIVALRKKILDFTSLQLNNGTTTPANYTSALADLLEAQNNQKIHRIEWLLAKANKKVVQGI